MDKCFKILKEGELKSRKRNERISRIVLNEFLNVSNELFEFYNCSSATEKVISLKDYIYTSNELECFFDILRKYNYNMKQEIYDAIKELGLLKTPQKNKDTIKKLLYSPVIDDISFNGKDEFKIFSEKYGSISFKLASEYFKTNLDILFYINQNDLMRYCHAHTYFLSRKLPNNYSITSLLDYYFEGKYYHSYTYDIDTNIIIDLCRNCIINKDQYDNMFSPKVVATTLNNKVDEEISIINKKLSGTKTESMVNLIILKIALYKQYLSSIGYNGSLEDAPSLGKKIVKK